MSIAMKNIFFHKTRFFHTQIDIFSRLTIVTKTTYYTFHARLKKVQPQNNNPLRLFFNKVLRDRVLIQNLKAVLFYSKRICYKSYFPYNYFNNLYPASNTRKRNNLRVYQMLKNRY